MRPPSSLDYHCCFYLCLKIIIRILLPFHSICSWQGPATQPRMPSNSWSSCLSLLSARIIGKDTASILILKIVPQLVRAHYKISCFEPHWYNHLGPQWLPPWPGDLSWFISALLSREPCPPPLLPCFEWTLGCCYLERFCSRLMTGRPALVKASLPAST